MKRKISEYDEANQLIDNCRTKAAKVESSVCSYVNGSEKFVCGNKIECDLVEEGPMNLENSHLPVKIMYSERETREEIEMVKRKEELVARERALVAFLKKKQGLYVESRAQNRLLHRTNRIDGLSMCLDEPYLIFEELEVEDMEDLREDIKVYLYLDRAKPTRVRFWEAFLVVCDWELAEARKKEALDIGEERELDSCAEADIKNLLEGKTYNQLVVLHSDIESQMRSASANQVDYWEPILKHVQVYKAKAFLKEECRVKILRTDYDGNNDQTGTEGAGSSSSPELLYGEGTGDNFEMKATGVMEEGDALSGTNGDALSGTNDKVNLRSPVYWPINKCGCKKPKYLNREGNNYNQILLSG
ncbi:hypothetical protein POM88_008624 [Heracleum sosnowskyi]|uniref:Splicing factor cactin central domain-containing protein n=1 Tax=Heracleum sosnowskyi TaxID=360622 RepID=A0AAD8N7J3_9APIA|nr:hypothetical protein POM88_008624 [Heracleum sosnowskyi]